MGGRSDPPTGVGKTRRKTAEKMTRRRGGDAIIIYCIIYCLIISLVISCYLLRASQNNLLRTMNLVICLTSHFYICSSAFAD